VRNAVKGRGSQCIARHEGEEDLPPEAHSYFRPKDTGFEEPKYMIAGMDFTNVADHLYG